MNIKTYCFNRSDHQMIVISNSPGVWGVIQELANAGDPFRPRTPSPICVLTTVWAHLSPDVRVSGLGSAETPWAGVPSGQWRWRQGAAQVAASIRGGAGSSPSPGPSPWAACHRPLTADSQALPRAWCRRADRAL